MTAQLQNALVWLCLAQSGRLLVLWMLSDYPGAPALYMETAVLILALGIGLGFRIEQSLFTIGAAIVTVIALVATFTDFTWFLHLKSTRSWASGEHFFVFLAAVLNLATVVIGGLA